MKHIGDENIYLYVISPKSLNKKDLEGIRLHIAECAECREFTDMVENFFTEYKKVENLTLDSPEHYSKIELLKARGGVRRVELPEHDSSVLALKPFNVFAKTQDRYYRLTAEQEPEDSDRFRHIYTYASAHKFIIMRVLYNSARKEYNLYLVCDDMSKVGNALINFEGEEADYVTDNEGVIKLNRDFIAENINVYIHLPISRFEVNLSELTPGKPPFVLKSKEKITLSLSKNNGGLKAVLDFEKKEDSKDLKAVVLYGENFDKHNSYSLQKNSFTFADPHCEKIKIVLVKKE